MTCPKCHGQMRQYERNGVTVDQCAECRGIFLDRGELEKLVDAENAWHGGAAAPQTPQAPQAPQAPLPPQAPVQQQPQYQYQQQPQYGQHTQHTQYGQYNQYGQHGHGHKKKKSFLDELFD